MYKPDYDTDVRTTVVKKQHNTMHTDTIDWDGFPFLEDCGTHSDMEIAEDRMEYLRLCDEFRDKTVMASNYGGCPRIWKKVIGVGMASMWPFWKPRPVVIVDGTLGAEWIDWQSLTGAKISEQETD